MASEIDLIARVGSDVGAPSVRTQQKSRAVLIDRIENARHGQSTFSQRLMNDSRIWRVAALVVLVAAVLIGIITFDGSGSGPSSVVVERAFAAISNTSGALHYVAEHRNASTGTLFYEEYWIDLNDPSRQRIVQTVDGRVFRQIVYVGGRSKYFSGEGKDHNPTTVVTQAPPTTPVGRGVDPASQGLAPLEAYREMLRAGEIKSQKETVVEGHPAVQLVIALKGVGEATYVVDRRTYFPLRFALADNASRFLEFEVLSLDKSELDALLQPKAQPAPYDARRGRRSRK